MAASHQVAPGLSATIVVAPQIRIVRMTDPSEKKNYLDKHDVYDPKLEGATTIRVRLGVMRNARLTIEHDPGSQVHSDFYKTYSDLTPPIVVTLPVPLASGVHDIVWSGRDSTTDHRVLLAGTYRLRLRGEGDGVAVEEVREISIAAPRAWNYGLDLINRHGYHEDSRPEVNAAAEGQAALSDGTKYDVTTVTTATGQEAAAAWSLASVGHFGSHSSPTGLMFVADKKKKSDIALGSATGADDISVPNEMAGVLDDCLLLCLAGCRGGNEILVVQMRLNQLRKALDCGTPDGDVGTKTELALRTYQKVAALEVTSVLDEATQVALGVGPEPAASEATIKAAQKKLKAASQAVNPGSEDGVYGGGTKRALSAFQTFVHLPDTGLPDAATRDRLLIGPGHDIQVNVADAIRRTAGADVVVGFQSYTFFDSSVTWAQSFWGELARGTTIEDAAATATSSVPPQRRKSAEYNIYADPTVGATIKILPARYGRSRF